MHFVLLLHALDEIVGSDGHAHTWTSCWLAVALIRFGVRTKGLCGLRILVGVIGFYNDNTLKNDILQNALSPTSADLTSRASAAGENGFGRLSWGDFGIPWARECSIWLGGKYFKLSGDGEEASPVFELGVVMLRLGIVLRVGSFCWSQYDIPFRGPESTLVSPAADAITDWLLLTLEEAWLEESPWNLNTLDCWDIVLSLVSGRIDDLEEDDSFSCLDDVSSASDCLCWIWGCWRPIEVRVVDDWSWYRSLKFSLSEAAAKFHRQNITCSLHYHPG